MDESLHGCTVGKAKVEPAGRAFATMSLYALDPCVKVPLVSVDSDLPHCAFDEHVGLTHINGHCQTRN